MISRRSQTGWSTHGHSAADVNIYASNPKDAAPLVGNHENTDVGKFLRHYLDVDVGDVTKELNQKGKWYDRLNADGTFRSWMGRMPTDGELEAAQHADHWREELKRGER